MAATTTEAQARALVAQGITALRRPYTIVDRVTVRHALFFGFAVQAPRPPVDADGEVLVDEVLFGERDLWYVVEREGREIKHILAENYWPFGSPPPREVVDYYEAREVARRYTDLHPNVIIDES